MRMVSGFSYVLHAHSGFLRISPGKLGSKRTALGDTCSVPVREAYDVRMLRDSVAVPRVKSPSRDSSSLLRSVAFMEILRAGVVQLVVGNPRAWVRPEF